MNRSVIAVILTTLILIIAGVFIYNKFINPEGGTKRSASGFLVINTDKYRYAPNEKVYIQITSLDKNGKTSCKSKLELIATDSQMPNAKYQIPIFISPTCSDNNVPTNNPDYYAYFDPENEGKYKLTLTDTDNKDTVETEFIVGTNQGDISFTRWSATKINANGTNRYPMVITVKANNNFSGVITDSIPSEFDFAWYGSATLTTGGSATLTTGGSATLTTGGSDMLTTGGSDEKRNMISWDVDLKKGESIELKYEYLPSQTDKNSYTIGPIGIKSGISSVDAGNTWAVTLQSL